MYMYCSLHLRFWFHATLIYGLTLHLYLSSNLHCRFQAVALISSPVTMATVSQKATDVMVMMTVETTVMKKDVAIVCIVYYLDIV